MTTRFTHIAAAWAAFTFACTGGDGPATPPFEPMTPPRMGLVLDPPREPQSPAPAALPRLSPCPDGWREVRDDGLRTSDPAIVTCDPWPDQGRRSCDRGEAHFPGEPGCTRIGSRCAAGDFAEDLPASGVLYVLATAAPNGDGSIAAPFRTVGDAIAAASEGTTIAIGKGRYDEELTATTPSITLAGACVAGTELTVSRYRLGAATLDVLAEGITVRNLRMSGERTVIRVGPGPRSTLVLRDVAIEDARHGGIVADGDARLDASNLIIRDVRETVEWAPDAPDGVGLISRNGAEVNLDRTAIERTESFALGCGIAGLRLNNTVVRRARGALTTDACRLEITASAIFDIRATSVELAGGTTATISDTLISGAESEDTRGGEIGQTVDVWDAEATFERTTIEGSEIAGITVSGAAGRLTLRDSVVRDLSGSADFQLLGTGIGVADGGRARLERVAVLRARSIAISAGLSTVLDASDVTIRDVYSSTEGYLGLGVGVELGATATIRRAEISRARSHAIIAHGATLAIEDLRVTDTRPQSFIQETGGLQDGQWGYALEVAQGAVVHVDRAIFDRNREAAISVLGAELFANDLVVRDTTSNRAGVLGRGLTAGGGAMIHIERARFERNREVAVFTFESAIDATDLVVESTRERACAHSRCEETPAGIGLASAGGEVELHRFRIAGNALAGVQVSRGGGVDLSEGEISGNPIGANVQIEGYDLARLRNRVIYRDNDLNLDAAGIYIPEALLDAGGPQ